MLVIVLCSRPPTQYPELTKTNPTPVPTIRKPRPSELHEHSTNHAMENFYTPERYLHPIFSNKPGTKSREARLRPSQVGMLLWISLHPRRYTHYSQEASETIMQETDIRASICHRYWQDPTKSMRIIVLFDNKYQSPVNDYCGCNVPGDRDVESVFKTSFGLWWLGWWRWDCR